MNQQKTKKALTLVELIIVIFILTLLSTIGFVSYSGYLEGVRDANRISNLKTLSDSLEIHSTKNTLPLPNDYVEVKANGEVIAYQGYIGKNILAILEFSNEGIDPKDKIYYSYYITKDRKYFQLMGFLEEQNNQDITGIFNQTNAIDYSTRYPKVYGKKLGILTDEFNTPIQEVTSIKSAGKIELDTTDTNTVFSAHINNGKVYTFSGSLLNHKLYTISKPGIYGPPKDCPEGFIPVWGDSIFDQEGFCVAKYEMSYEDGDTPDSCDTQYPDPCTTEEDFNTIRYQDGKKIVSIIGKYPIANIKQSEAITSCMSLGKGYHLITNNEWMSIARNIELEAENWSSGEVGIGHIYNGISNNTTLGCDATGGETETRTYATRTGMIGEIECEDRRKHLLSNAQYIWDLSGNVGEHVNKGNTIDGTGYNVGKFSLLGSSNGVGFDDDGLYNSNDMDMYGSIFNLGIANGMGNIYYADGANNNIITRGGEAQSDYNAGIYNMGGLNQEDGIQHSRKLGFRCAYIKQ